MSVTEAHTRTACFRLQVGKFILTGKNSLYILLPLSNNKKALQDLEALLTEANVRGMVKEMASISPVRSEVLLPKTKLLVNTDLHTVLKELGQIYCFTLLALSVSFPLTAFKKIGPLWVHVAAAYK